MILSGKGTNNSSILHIRRQAWQRTGPLFNKTGANFHPAKPAFDPNQNKRQPAFFLTENNKPDENKAPFRPSVSFFS